MHWPSKASPVQHDYHGRFPGTHVPYRRSVKTSRVLVISGVQMANLPLGDQADSQFKGTTAPERVTFVTDLPEEFGLTIANQLENDVGPWLEALPTQCQDFDEFTRRLDQESDSEILKAARNLILSPPERRVFGDVKWPGFELATSGPKDDPSWFDTNPCLPRAGFLFLEIGHRHSKELYPTTATCGIV